MANSGFRIPQVGGLPRVKTGECPCVADLIDYAQGQIGNDERRRIETHLKKSKCSHCQSWIAKAILPAGQRGSLTPSPDSPLPKSSSSDSKWQHLALRDLEERLRHLDEAN